MEVLHRQSPSSPALNPNAPIFIPMTSYLTIEDFSDQWWDLVHSSPSFRDYWLHDCFQDPQSDPLFLDDFDFDHLDLPNQEKEEDEKMGEKGLITVGSLMWHSSGGRAEAPRNFQKAPKIVKSVRVSPRTINQPR